MKETLDKIYVAIEHYSKRLGRDAKTLTRELGSAKNYVCTPDLQHWTFGKSVGADGEYHYNGGAAKRHLYNLGFIDALQHTNKKEIEKVVNAFRLWASKVKGYPILEKFDQDQATSHRFELLVHKDVFAAPKTKTPLIGKPANQLTFDEGHKKEITLEIAFRDRKLIEQAKAVHGTKCLVCDFDFGEIYGSHGEGFIEMHHLHPIAQGARKTTIEELAPVCANCHRMLHKGNQLLSIKELKQIISTTYKNITHGKKA